MPNYNFTCLNKKCNETYDYVTSYDETGKWDEVSCPTCKSKRKKKNWTGCFFGATSSKRDNFEYLAKELMEKAENERRAADGKDIMGDNPYKDFNDLGQDANYDPANWDS